MKNDMALVVAALSGGPDMFSPIVERYQDAVPLDCVVNAFLDEKDRRVQRSLRKLMRAVLDAQKSNKGEE